MKKLLIAGFALALLVPACAFAQDAFTGTWKMDASSVHDTGGKPMTMTLKDGMFTDNSKPPINIKADGEDHAASGQANFDSIAVKVVDDHTIERTTKRNGQTRAVATFAVAPDGKTATATSTMNRNGSESTSKAMYHRVGTAPAGSNAVSGSWRLDHLEDMSGAGPSYTYKVDGDKIEYRSAVDGSYTGVIGGKPVPYMQDGKQRGTVSVKRLDKNTLRETYFMNGKPWLTSTMTLSADGKTITSANRSMDSGTTRTWNSIKQ